MSRRAAKNPWVGINYIPDNPRMETPPAFFLQQIYDFDSMLVIMPSRHVPFAYVVARRKQFGKGLTVKAIDAQYTQPDTKMCIMHNTVPVCLMHKTGPTWSADKIIASLRARDIWAHGGADKVADMLEEQEAAEREKTRKAIRDDLWNRSGDAWRSYQARTGQRTRLTVPARNGSAIQSASSSTATSGLVTTD